MIITFNTQHFFKLQAGDMVVALNPTAGVGTKKVSKFGADVALQCTYDPEGLGYAQHGTKEPIDIYGPGSYEVQGIPFEGFGVAQGDEGAGQGAVYSFLFDDIRVGVLGEVSDKKLLSPEALEALSESDLIFAAATDEGFELASSFSPHIIAMGGYNDPKEAADFTTTLSAEQHESLDKLTIKHKDITDKQSFVYVFSA